MDERILPLLCCPECRSELALEEPEREDGRVKRGQLGCTGCERAYAVRDFIPRFVDGDNYVGSFSLQWKIFRQAQLDSVTHSQETRSRFIDMTGSAAHDLEACRVLDVGCGPGKFIETVREMGAEVFGVDLSFAVDAALENFGHDPRIHLLQADVFKLPFREEVFDMVFSLGVLHHTPDCEGAFKGLARFVKPGGKLAIWVYSQDIVPHFNRRLRSFTRRMPFRLLYYACLLPVPFTYLFNVPYLRAAFYGLRPYFQWITWGSWRQRWLDTLDWYSCWFQSAHTYPEVHRWFLDLGLESIELGQTAVSVHGRRPKRTGTISD